MLKLNNSFLFKKLIRYFLIVIIFLELIFISIALWDYFYSLVWQGLSTSSYKVESNYFVRLLNFFEIGLSNVVKEWITNLILPLFAYMVLRDRDRETIHNEEMKDITNAVKKGLREGVQGMKTDPKSKDVRKKDLNKSSTKEEPKKEISENKEESNDKKDNDDTDDFFATFGS